MNWEIVATFDNPVAAEMAKNLLESHGLLAMLADEETVAIAWQLSSAVGGIKLLVPAASLGRAEYLLDHKAAPPVSDEEIAAAVAASPEIAAELAGAAEPFDDTATDREVDRILKATVFAMLFFPIQLYTLVRLWMLRYADPPVRSSDRWKIRLAYALSLPLWFAVTIPSVLLVGHFLDRPGGAGWRNERFGGLGDVALTIDFPGQFVYDLREEQTVLGPAKIRAFGTSVDANHFLATIKSLPKELTPADPQAASLLYVERQFANPGYEFESKEATSIGGYRGTEVVIRFIDGVTRQPRVVRESVVLVDHHIVILSTDVPAEKRDGKDCERFFRSAKIQ